MATHRLTTAVEWNVVDTGSCAIDNLANGANAITSTAFDNSVNRWPFCGFDAELEWVATPTLNALFKIWLLPALDGVTYSDGGSGVDPTIAMAEAFPSRAVATVQNFSSPFPIQLMPVKYHILVMNDGGAAMENSDTCELSIWSWGYESI